MYHVIIPTKVINLKLNSDYILAKVPDYLIEVQYLIKLKTRQHSKLYKSKSFFLNKTYLTKLRWAFVVKLQPHSLSAIMLADCLTEPFFSIKKSKYWRTSFLVKFGIESGAVLKEKTFATNGKISRSDCFMIRKKIDFFFIHGFYGHLFSHWYQL